MCPCLRNHIQVFAHGFNMWDGGYCQYCINSSELFKAVHGNQPQHSTTLHNNKWLSNGIGHYSMALTTLNHYYITWQTLLPFRS